MWRAQNACMNQGVLKFCWDLCIPGREHLPLPLLLCFLMSTVCVSSCIVPIFPGWSKPRRICIKIAEECLPIPIGEWGVALEFLHPLLFPGRKDADRHGGKQQVFCTPAKGAWDSIWRCKLVCKAMESYLRYSFIEISGTYFPVHLIRLSFMTEDMMGFCLTLPLLEPESG